MIRFTALLLAFAFAFAFAKAPYQYHFPRDHAAHPAYRTEWWYSTGHLQAENGKRFGYELTFFRIGMRPDDPPPQANQSRWRGNELYTAHFAITDEEGKRFFHTERLAREALGQGGASERALAVHVSDWNLTGTSLHDSNFERMTMHAADAENALDLTQLPEKPPAVHGIGGISRKGPCASCASHYYSYTRLRTNGTLTYQGMRMRVTGISWMDHEFGSSELAPDQVGWDWFSIQLDDHREIMLYEMRQKDGTLSPQSSGSLIEPNGKVRHLTLRDFHVESTGTWKSPHTAAIYPSGWNVTIPAERIALRLRPLLADQELARAAGASYWEGAVEVRQANHLSSINGQAYVELTGYAAPLHF